jgi:hypothetical protein
MLPVANGDPGETLFPPGEAGIAAPAPPVGFGDFEPSPEAVIAALDVGNRDYPGLGAAAAANDLRGAAGIVWEVLRERRLVNAALARGPGGSGETAAAPAYQAAFSAIGHLPVPDFPETPETAAARLDRIVDAFSRPVVDEPAFGALMERALVRLYADLNLLRAGLSDPGAEGDPAWLELSRVYFRARDACDFLVFPGRRPEAEFGEMARRAAGYFYPDGASRAGDAGGITGGLFAGLLRLEALNRDAPRFRREMAPSLRLLAGPARHLLNLALPDGSLPAFGPRGSRELTPSELGRLEELFPPAGNRVVRVGLAASRSFPNLSGQESFGGVFVSRDGEGDRYLAIRFGPAGILKNVPVHHDFGSLALMSGGTPFLIDPGGYGGESAGGGAHSVLSLDDQYVLPDGGNQPGRPVETVWRTNAALDYASDRAFFADGGSWQRTLVYVKNLPGESSADYWLLLDQAGVPAAGRAARARIRFQFAPDLQVYNDGNGVTAASGRIGGPILRLFPLDDDAETAFSTGTVLSGPVADASGFFLATAVDIRRTLPGGGTLATLIYPGEGFNGRPARIERDSDIVSGHSRAIVVDHGGGRIDVIAWSPVGSALVTPTLNLQLSADLAVFRLRSGRFVRINFINLEHFRAKEPEGGIWSLRVAGPAQTLTLEPERNGGWQVLSDPANQGEATLYDINLGPVIGGRRLGVRPGEFGKIRR